MNTHAPQPRRLAWAMTLTAALVPVTAFAADPQLTRVSPAGVTAGEQRVITLLGDRLADATGVLFYRDGLKVTQVEVVDAKQLKLHVETDAGLSPDLYPFRLITKTGLSNLRLLGVSQFPSAEEVEPNDDFANPQAVSPRTTVDGTVRGEDVDYFAVDLKAGQTISVELEGLRHAVDQNLFDPSLVVWDADRFQVAASDDAALLRLDCATAFKAERDGRYVIEVREAVYGGNDNCLYRLHVSDQTRPVAVVPGGGKPGQQLDATMIDALGNRWQETLTLPPAGESQFAFWSDREGIRSPSPNTLVVAEAEHSLEAEPNNERSNATPIATTPAIIYGALAETGDEDYFSFDAKKDQPLIVRSLSRKTLRSPLDTVLNVFKLEGGGSLGGNDDQGGPDSEYEFKPPEDGKYVVRIRDHLERGGEDFVYAIEIAPKLPEVFPSIAEQERYVAQSIVVPKGSRFAVDVTVNRKNVGGDAVVALSGLPAGLRSEPVTCPADRGSVPVMIYADADAAPAAAALAEMTATIQPKDQPPLIGRLQQRVQLIRGQNNRDVWGHDGNRVAAAVAEAAPFDIVVTQPAVPIVRDGSLDLQVQLTRREDFKGQVRLRLLSTPPGVSASGSIKFEPDQTAVTIPVTANGNARFGNWPIVVMAWTRVEGGEVKIAAEPINLEVADRAFEFKFNKSMAEIGKSVDVVIGAKMARVVEGVAEVELVGLPPGTTCAQTKVPLAADQESVIFKLDVAADAKAGSFKTISCRGTVTAPTGVITQTNGTGEVQIDAPLVTPTPAAAPQQQAAAEAQPAPKALTRLEQLRALRASKTN